jgi:hypothetical protein
LQVLKDDLVQAETTIGQAKQGTFHESWAVFYLPVLSAEADLRASFSNLPDVRAVLGDERTTCTGMREL